MKRLIVAGVVFFSALTLCVPGALADPRMETNDNFCHFILDPANTDNEVFLADCAPVITVTENETPALRSVEECHDNYSARGFAQAVRVVPAVAAPVAPGTRLVLTSRDSEYPCYMVESNGRQYESRKWRSTISVEERDGTGFVKVFYSLLCM